ncbi:MAG: Tol-Pal system beta propeller repeat protein TolB [Nitrospirae bacterium CG_4_10_14_0_8_um_filter_41_23]|nr:Tol-Pal system beta propeller repeat protein TolB [Nitrospirota bacterium]OIP59754.1 MAG: Tol-Pal system beta propeller repeat protein TolB [Nitrospirae bacterium CG2_30_41_42]PIQ93702.1 MAG: Tol-Pal system beta propeller repeat protein TolB [Nitrospirae bacterium CG11_big_fil_rev_8_21_14_0_20_41_14]PIV42198.1 MAG: Tol-Pal system beta propeller repeat protein TolB [Nitrospirae bacterium CG02_land_8_20_14_3_00_41_53]PIW87946.1 MAG: Tol-Pal system beta propeller repeat protein TolB [Nitrospira
MKKSKEPSAKSVGQKGKNKIIRSILLVLCSMLYALCIALCVEAKVYIDISSPAFKKLPIAIQEFSGPSGKEISNIIRDDLEFTGLFLYIDRNAYLENPSQPFNPKNWTPIGVEAIVKGSVQEGKELSVTVSLYEVFEGKEIFKKEYKAEKEFIRPLSHAIANDIYYTLTGETGIFRSRISFVAEDKDKIGIYIMDWDGNRITNMGLKGNIILPPRWSRDGTKLIYSAERNRQWGIYLLYFKNMSERKVFSAKGTNIVGDFLPEGNDITLSSSKDGTPDLYIMNLNNNQIIKLTSSYGIEVSPAVSPDGKYIAFVSDRGGSPQIYTMRRDGSDRRRITFEGSYNTSPSWSPKGDRIVFVGRRGTNQIFTVRPDGSGLTQLTTVRNNEEPSFSPDGMYITFSSDRNRIRGIYIMRANGESQKRITPKNLRASGPRWSPN